ncbi:MAG: hypothetical protein U9R02_02235, partial [Thermodesulfobacteriota bacterium]|nr:hypothetical protein [Thermodesulfobacteriota bacterium]
GSDNWGYVKISASGSVLENCQFLHGGVAYKRHSDQREKYLLWISTGTIDIRRCIFKYAYETGIYYSSSAADSKVIISANELDYCPTGVTYNGSFSVNSIGKISGNTFNNGSIGIDVLRVGTSLETHRNRFEGLSSYGIRNNDSSGTVQAQANWWGDTTGPRGEGGGDGAPVSTYVNFSDWRASPDQGNYGVWNVIAQRRSGTMLVDVYYDLIGDAGSTYWVDFQVSATGGSPYDIISSNWSLSGAVGDGISPGDGLHILWDAAADGGSGYTDRMRVRITADLE